MAMNEEFGRTLALLLSEVPAVLRGGVASTAEIAEWQPHDGMLGSIGFGGAEMRGSIVLVGERTVWKKLAPPEVGSLPDGLLCDLVGELCNILVGSFRNQLLRHGIELACGTPTAAYGHISLPRLPKSSALQVASHRIDLSGGSVYLRTDILFGDHFVFPESTDRIAPAQDDLFF